MFFFSAGPAGEMEFNVEDTMMCSNSGSKGAPRYEPTTMIPTHALAHFNARKINREQPVWRTHLMAMNGHLIDLLRKLPDTFIILVEKPECAINTCFWCVPKRYRKEPRMPKLLQKLDLIPATVKKLMVRNGSLTGGHSPQGKIPNCFRNVISNPGVYKGDIQFLVNELDDLEKDL